MWREHTVNENDSAMIRRRLYELNEPARFEEFDRFLMKKILGEDIFAKDSIPVVTIQTMREKAYQIFYKKVKSEEVASRATIKKWFGLDGYVRPKRKQILKLAFALQLDENGLQEYLTCGILQPGIQINDYREMVYLYGLGQGLSYEECVDMIGVFETWVYKDTVLEQNTHTTELWKMFRANSNKPKEEFLSWMCSNAGFFKGYSKVALHHFIDMKKEMLDYIRKSARDNLFRLLKQTDFYDWALQNHLSEEEYDENISRYIKNMSRRKDRGAIPDDLREEIVEMNWVANSSRDKTTDLLAELYASALETNEKTHVPKKRIRYKSREGFKLPEQIFFMTDKHISQIVGIAQQKEKEIRLSQALGSLEHTEGPCPEWVGRMLMEYGIEASMDDAGKVKGLLRKLLAMQEQRCHLVRRDDLLPLIHYVAQKRYERILQETGKEYNCEDARIYFIQMADQILTECRMALVCEEYHLDYLLLSCYGEEEMYSLADAIEESWMLE